MFSQKCATFWVTFVLTGFICVLAILAVSVCGTNAMVNAYVTEWGAKFWQNYNCYQYQFGALYYGTLCPINYCIFDLGCSCRGSTGNCNSSDNFAGGYVLAAVNSSFLILWCFYCWFGSWCCDCCSCQQQALNTPDVIQVNTAPAPQQQVVDTVTTNTVMMGGNTYNLLVHHGGSIPTKVVVTAGTLEQLLGGIAAQLGINVPFSIAVFDPSFNQYAGLANLASLPQNATVQVVFHG